MKKKNQIISSFKPRASFQKIAQDYQIKKTMPQQLSTVIAIVMPEKKIQI